MRAEAAKHKVEIVGDSERGTIRGAAVGSYAREGRTLEVEITKKPLWAPWPLIEAGARRAFDAVERIT